VAAGDFDNDGLPDLCVLTQAGPELYRNAKGRFEKKEAKLPAGPFEAALWFDFDHDYDLDLLLFGKKSLLLRNENGTFQDYTGRFPFAPGHAIAVVPLRVVPDTEARDLAVAYRDHSGVLYRDGLRGVFQARRFAALPAGAASLRAVDIDNDGWTDVAYASSKGVSAALNRRGRFEAIRTPAPAAGSIAFADLESRGFPDLVSTDAVFRNQGLGKFASGKAPPGFAAAVAWAEADFDGDGRADLAAVAKDGSLHLLTNQTVTKNQSLRVALNGVKNLRTAVGAEVEVKAGDHYQKRIYAGTPLLFGLGPRAEVDTVRISWPNGLLQNQPGQKAGAALFTEAPRLAGSCPMVFSWDGHGFRFVSDVLGVAPLGASSGDGQYFPVDTDEYLALEPGALAAREGRYEIRITEELHEISYIDQVRLIAVDHPEETEIFTNDKFKSPPFPEFRLFGVKRRIYPVAARDGNGKDVLAALNDRDGVYVKGFHHDAAGKAEMHALELDFPAGVARDNRAVLVLNGWIDWADGSTFMAASQGGAGLIMPYLQVKDATGNWRTVVEDMGAPSGGPKTIAVDLTDKFLSASRGIRIVTNVCLYWDQIFLSEQVQTPPSRMTAVDAATVDLRLRGFSKAMVDPRRERPEWYDYAHWEPSAMWNPVRGRYTRYGDVRELTGEVDDRFVIMGSGDELQLTFDARQLPAVPRGWKRDWLFFVDGWSKDADANTAFGDSVEPLPFHGMSQYPYPASERFPDDALHRAWRERYNTRREMRLMERLAWTAKPGPN
ncbi:MAG: Tetratricopeptide 2 repeat protein, partial [candidate division NC10 bacterium]|nr:Tetratricopeptide 2 repeat protein [candidate division NC10 bacterium]